MGRFVGYFGWFCGNGQILKFDGSTFFTLLKIVGFVTKIQSCVFVKPRFHHEKKGHNFRTSAFYLY